MIKIDRLKLIEALKIVKPVIGTDELEVFIFRNGRIYGLNQGADISIPFDTGLTCCVRYPDAFLATLEAMEAKEIQFVVKSAKAKKDEIVPAGISVQHIYIKSDTKELGQKAKFPLGYISDLSDYVRAASKKSKVHKISKDFIMGLALCLNTVGGPDVTDPALFGVYIDGNDIFSSDNFRISRYSISKMMPRMLLPQISGRIIAALPMTACVVEKKNAFFYFPFGPKAQHMGRFATDLDLNEYPDSPEHFAGFEIKKHYLPKESIQKHINLVQTHFENSDNPLRTGLGFSTNKEDLVAFIDNVDKDITYQATLKKKGKKGMELRLCAKYLHDAFALFGRDDVNIVYQKSRDGNSVCLVAENFRQLILQAGKEAEEDG